LLISRPAHPGIVGCHLRRSRGEPRDSQVIP
jgi:hypothetical protein